MSGVIATTKGIGAVKAGDGGVKFRAEWPDLDQENVVWMKENRIDPATGDWIPDPDAPITSACSSEVAALRRGPSGSGVVGAVVGGGNAAKQAGQGWVRRHKFMVGALVVIGYVLLARLMGDGIEA